MSINHKISLITANKNKKIFFNKKINFISSNSNFFNNKSRIIKSMYCCYLLYKYFKNKKATIISFQANVSAILVAKVFGYKIIIRSNQSPTFYAKNFLKRKFMRFFFKRADKVIVNSKDFQNEFKKYFNLNSTVIYNLFEKPKIIKKLSKKPIKQNFFKNSKKIINILSIGRLVAQKDYITILKALNLIKNKKKYKLIIIGKGVDYIKLVSFIKKKN